MTQVTIIGTLGGDPELRFTRTNIPVLSFSVASSKRIKDGDEWKDGPTSWRRVTAWRGLAEALATQLTKGKHVIIVGEEEVRTYETETGGKGTSVEVTADHVGLYVFPQRAVDRPQEPATGTNDAWATPGAYDTEQPF